MSQYIVSHRSANLIALLGWMAITFAPCRAAAPDVSNADWARQYAEIQAKIASRRLAKQPGANDALLANPHAGILPGDRDPLDVILRRTQALLDKLRSMGKDLPGIQPRLDDIIRRAGASGLAKSTAVGTPSRADLYYEATALRKQAAFSNPLLNFNQLLFIERGALANGNGESNGDHCCDEYYGHNGKAGGGLYILKDPWNASPQKINVLQNSVVQKGLMAGQSLNGGSFQGPDLSFDGTRIAFAWSPGGGVKWDQRNRFRIFVVNVDGANLTQLTGDVNEDDFDPCWLPGDQRIAFVSTRRGGYGRCHPRIVPTYTLYSMKDDGSDIVCLSYHETNEWQPSVDNDGMIVYTRWDYVDRDAVIAHHFWKCYPDGRDPRSYHGNYPLPLNTIDPYDGPRGLELRPMSEFNYRAIPGMAGKYVATAGPHHGQAFGDIMLLDVTRPDSGAANQIKKITSGPLYRDNTGEWGTPWPLSDAFFICNYLTGLYLVDAFGNKELIYQCTSNQPSDPGNLPALFRPLDPMPVRAKKLADGSNYPILATQTYQGERFTLADRKPATMLINNVALSDIPLPVGVKIKWLRIVQLIPKATPIDGDPMTGYGTQSLVRMPLGIVPVEDDGSVYCEAPVGKAIYFQLLDEKGMAVHSMRSATYVHPGEQLACAGCHENKWQAVPPNNTIASRRAASTIIPEVIDGAIPFNWHRLVEPVVQARCAPCHLSQQKGPDMSYASLGKYAFVFQGAQYSFTKQIVGGSRVRPGKFGARFAALTAYLDSSHCKTILTDEERRRITLWLDLNSNELGAYTRVAEQRRGEIVWPELDVDPQNPLGVERPVSTMSAARVTIAPQSISVKPQSTVQFSAHAIDAAQRPIASQPTFTWSVSGGGTIGATGLFTAGAVEGGPYFVRATATINGSAMACTASVAVFTVNTVPLSPGTIKNALALVNNTGSPYLPIGLAAGIESKYTGATALIPAAGATATVNATALSWAVQTQADGLWFTGSPDNFVAYLGFSLINPTQRSVKIALGHDDGVTVWMNGAQVVNLSNWDGGQEVLSSAFTLPAGSSSFLIKLQDGSGVNRLSARFTDASGNDLSDLLYPNLYSMAIERMPLANQAAVIIGAHGALRLIVTIPQHTFSASLFNVLGKKVWSYTGRAPAQVVLPNSISGVYYLLFFSEGKRMIKQVMLR
jgi:hypothetical protein